MKAELPSWESGTFDAVAVRGGPGIVISTRLDSILPSAVQTAPSASQSVVTGSTTVTAPVPVGRTWICHPALLPSTRRRALNTSPPVTVKAWSRRVLKLRGKSSLKCSSKVKAELPSWEAGALDAVAARGARATAAVASLVKDSSFPASSVKDTRTLIVLPASVATSV